MHAEERHWREYREFCRMTCDGGSERGSCDCQNPTDCQLQDRTDYQYQRDLSTKRYAKFFIERLLLGEEIVDPPPVPYFDFDDPNAPT